MKIAILTDTHAGARNDSQIFQRYHQRFFDDVFFPYVTEHKIKRILHLGDILERRKFINFNTLNSLNEYFLDKLDSAGLRMDLILGNHDVVYKNTNDLSGATELFEKHPSLHIHTKPVTLTIGGVKFAMVPWITKDNYEDSMKFIGKTPADICCGHFAFDGFEVMKGTKFEGGTEPKVVKNFDKVWSGHFHTKQKKGNIQYLGTPYQITWGDYGQKKGFHVFDTETRKLDFIENPLQIFIKLFYDDKENDYTDMTVSPNEYHEKYLKIMVINKTQPYMFDQYLDTIDETNPSNITIVEDISDYEIGEDEIVNMSESTIEILNNHIDHLEFVEDKTFLKNLMKDLHTEAIMLDENME
jgi:DNA repair exonuclease SbcCD nuclease subunit